MNLKEENVTCKECGKGELYYSNIRCNGVDLYVEVVCSNCGREFILYFAWY